MSVLASVFKEQASKVRQIHACEVQWGHESASRLLPCPRVLARVRLTRPSPATDADSPRGGAHRLVGGTPKSKRVPFLMATALAIFLPIFFSRLVSPFVDILFIHNFACSKVVYYK